jgi:HEPN domain-containing protein
MKPATAEWVAKAEGDFQTAQRELAVPGAANHDAVCFHAQQCAEKYLKAILVENGSPFPKVHDLSALLTLLLPLSPDWGSYRQACDSLTSSAVEVRYPGFSADREDAEAAVQVMELLRGAARKALGLAS